jgi:hypothetical protein
MELYLANLETWVEAVNERPSPETPRASAHREASEPANQVDTDDRSHAGDSRRGIRPSAARYYQSCANVDHRRRDEDPGEERWIMKVCPQPSAQQAAVLAFFTPREPSGTPQHRSYHQRGPAGCNRKNTPLPENRHKNNNNILGLRIAPKNPQKTDALLNSP